mgnify:CR=1 FL=1
MKYIPYGRQYIDNNDKKSVLTSLSNHLITTGPFVEKFENKLKKYFNTKHSFVCSSGTAALHLAMLSIGLKKDDIILMPAINFIASYNMAKSMQSKVYLVDVDEYTGQVTPDKVLDCIKKNKLKKIKALILMYNGGYPECVQKFYEIKKKHNFLIIEDACHALGAEYRYKKKFLKIGSCKHSDISTFSLHPLKSITSGEGGIVTTNNNKISKNIKLFRNHGILRNKKNYWNYDILEHGYNYRLSDINCALGLSQLKKISFFLKKRKSIYFKYVKEFENFNQNLILPKYSNSIRPAFHLFFININFSRLKKNKDNFMRYLVEKKILAQQHYIPIYKFKVYKERPNKFLGAEKFFKNAISLPIFVNLNVSKQKRIITIIKKYFKK